MRVFIFFGGCIFFTNERVIPDSKLVIFNSSSDTVVFDLIFQKPNSEEITKFSRAKDFAVVNNTNFIIIPNGELIIDESFINQLCMNSDERIILYFFKKSTLLKNPWEKIVADKLFLKRYELGLDDLQGNQWVIEYDGM